MPQTLALPVKLKAIVRKLTETNTQVPLQLSIHCYYGYAGSFETVQHFAVLWIVLTQWFLFLFVMFVCPSSPGATGVGATSHESMSISVLGVGCGCQKVLRGT